MKQCKMKHDLCRSTKIYKYAGQNLAYRANSGDFESLNTLIEKVIKGWYDEVKNAEKSDIERCCDSASGKTIGHFTQVMLIVQSKLDVLLQDIRKMNGKLHL